jgi:hypothetical protein
MFGMFKFRKLNNLLDDANITTNNKDRINNGPIDINRSMFDSS